MYNRHFDFWDVDSEAASPYPDRKRRVEASIHTLTVVSIHLDLVSTPEQIAALFYSTCEDSKLWVQLGACGIVVPGDTEQDCRRKMFVAMKCLMSREQFITEWGLHRALRRVELCGR